MKKEYLVKTFALGIVALFICVSYQPIIAEKTTSVDKTSNYNNVDFEEAKEYLFQTIVEISNNQDVKEFLNENKLNIISNYYDCKNEVQKISSQNPKLLKSILFTKPEMTYEYLETNYNNGLEIKDILGEEESLDIVESVKIVNPDLFIELKNIIANDEKLSNRISVLEEMNNNLISKLDFSDHPIICRILGILFLPVVISVALALFIKRFFFNFIRRHLFSIIFLAIPFISILIYGFPIFVLLVLFGCFNINPLLVIKNIENRS